MQAGRAKVVWMLRPGRVDVENELDVETVVRRGRRPTAYVSDYHKQEPDGRSRPTPDPLPDPLWYPTLEVDDSPVSTPPRTDMPGRGGRVPAKLRHLGERSILMPEKPAVIAPQDELTGQLSSFSQDNWPMLHCSETQCWVSPMASAAGDELPRATGSLEPGLSPSQSTILSGPANAHNGRPKLVKTAAARGVGAG